MLVKEVQLTVIAHDDDRNETTNTNHDNNKYCLHFWLSMSQVHAGACRSSGYSACHVMKGI